MSLFQASFAELRLNQVVDLEEKTRALVQGRGCDGATWTWKKAICMVYPKNAYFMTFSQVYDMLVYLDDMPSLFLVKKSILIYIYRYTYNMVINQWKNGGTVFSKPCDILSTFWTRFELNWTCCRTWWECGWSLACWKGQRRKNQALISAESSTASAGCGRVQPVCSREQQAPCSVEKTAMWKMWEIVGCGITGTWGEMMAAWRSGWCPHQVPMACQLVNGLRWREKHCFDLTGLGLVVENAKQQNNWSVRLA